MEELIQQIAEDFRKTGIAQLVKRLDESLAARLSQLLRDELREPIVGRIANDIAERLNPWWTPKFTAKLLGCSVRTVRRKIEAGLIPTTTVAGELYVDGSRMLENVPNYATAADNVIRSVELKLRAPAL